MFYVLLKILHDFRRGFNYPFNADDSVGAARLQNTF